MRYTAAVPSGELCLTEVEVRHSDGEAIRELLKVSERMWSELQALPLGKVFAAPKGRRLRVFYALLRKASERLGFGEGDYLSGYASPSEGGLVVLYFRSLPKLGEVTVRAVFRPDGVRRAFLMPVQRYFRPLPRASECPQTLATSSS